MKTNNVDFGKSFKFKTGSHDLIYTCSAVDSKGECIVSWDWGKGDGVESTDYMGSSVRDFIKRGSWIVLPSNTKETIEKSPYPIKFDTGSLLDQIKHFTATSNHSVFVRAGIFEVYQAGMPGFPYKCKDDEQLRSVMQALSVLDKVVCE